MSFRILLIAILWATAFSAIAKNAVTHKAEGYATFEGDRRMSYAEIEEAVIQKAKEDALAKIFGIKVTSVDALYMKDDVVNISSQSTNEIRGQWLETTDLKISEPVYSSDGRMTLECHIKGIVREISSSIVDFEVLLLKNKPDRNSVAIEEKFEDGDALYVYFKSPVSGWLNIYLIDSSNAFCLLPYRNSPDGAYLVEADKEYIFFSPQTKTKFEEFVDEYELSTNEDQKFEVNTLDFYFSPQEFSKGNMTKIEEDTSRPRETTLSNYNKWRTLLLSKNDHVSSKTYSLKIFPAQ